MVIVSLSRTSLNAFDMLRITRPVAQPIAFKLLVNPKPIED
jgi:hypothetical protein